MVAEKPSSTTEGAKEAGSQSSLPDTDVPKDMKAEGENAGFNNYIVRISPQPTSTSTSTSNC
jgi:hypothetical protein